MKFRTLAALSLTGLSLLAASGKPKAFPYAYDQLDMENGLRVITVPTSYPNVVALYIVVRTGSRNEVEPGQAGFAHFFEHMMFRGTESFPPDKYNECSSRPAPPTTPSRATISLPTTPRSRSEDLATMMRHGGRPLPEPQVRRGGLQTEALAVLGEYNKNAASRSCKIDEVCATTAFKKHTYKHTTMGFLARHQGHAQPVRVQPGVLRPLLPAREHDVMVVGDVNTEQVRDLAKPPLGRVEEGTLRIAHRTEPPQNGPRSAHIEWPTPTLPVTTIAFRAPAYSDADKDYAALDLIADLGFGQNSPLYKALVLDKQQADSLNASNNNHRDPYLFTITTRLKKRDDMPAVQEEITSALAGFKDTLVAPHRLDRVRRNLRYSLALSMDNSEAIARQLAYAIALRRTPDTLNKLAEVYETITPEEIRQVARKYFDEANRTVVTLTGATK